MGKSKQAQNLSHEEIWDDSALVRSWDEAVQEYQLYHSIHAKGEDIEDVLKEAEMAGLAGDAEGSGGADAVCGDEAMDAEREEAENQFDGTASDGASRVAPSVAEASQSAAGGPTPANPPAPNFPTGAMPMPEPALSHVQDENLKRLMMAWYFAGYYTGLYEGQQQARQGKS